MQENSTIENKSNQLIVMDIDRSGSMRGKEEDTVGGVNTFISTHKITDYDVTFTLSVFDNDKVCIIPKDNIKNVKEITKDMINPRGQTAMLDCMGSSLKYITENYVNYGNCLYIIYSDGEENASKNYTKQHVIDLIENLKKNTKFEIMYVGTNQDSISNAKTFGINPNSALNYRAGCEKGVFTALANAAKRSRTSDYDGFSQIERTQSTK